MTYQERRAFVIASTQIIATIGFVLFVLQSRSGQQDLKYWADTTLLMMPIFLGLHVLTLIVFFISQHFTSNESVPKITDERDQEIELKASRFESGARLAGLFSFLLALHFEAKISTAFWILLGWMLLSGISSSMARVVLYRRGS